MKNEEKLNYLKKFNVRLDEETKQAILNGMISVKDVLSMNKDCCDFVTILKPSDEYTLDEREFFDKYVHSILEIGQERDVVIDYAETDDEITVQVKHKDIWYDFQSNMGWIDNWYGYYLKYEGLGC